MILVLLLVKLRGGGERIDEDEGWFGGIVGVGHLVAGLDTAEMGDLDSLGGRHYEYLFCVLVRAVVVS